MMASTAPIIAHQYSQSARIGQQFSAASHSYDQVSRLQRLTGRKLFETHIDLFCGQVLDLGCGTGVNTQRISSAQGQVIGCDLAFDMTLKTRATTAQQVACVVGDAEQLPFANQAFSVVYSNLMLQWIDDLSVPLREIKRVLKPGGKLLFTTLLDGTLSELKRAWSMIDNDNHVNQFSQFHILKQVLESSGFDHQITLETIELDYQDVTELARELKQLGANYVKNRSNKGLMGRQKWLQLNRHYQRYQKADGLLPATYQVAYVRASAKVRD